MILEGEYRFDGPREAVWNLLLDPDVLVKALPGAKALTRTAEDKYEGRMNVGVGPVTAAEFAMTVEITDKVHPERYTMHVGGKGALGFTQGAAAVELEPQGEESTVMRYRADLKVGGKIAGIGQRLLETVAKTMTKHGLDALSRELAERLKGRA